MSSATDWISAVSTGIGVLLTGGAAWFAWREYEAHKATRRADLAASLFAQMANDVLVDFATTSLDWGKGLIVIPPDWRALVEVEKPSYDPIYVEDALTVQLTNTTANSGIRSLYRHAFVRLFNQLEMVALQAERDPELIKELGEMAFVAHRLSRPKYVQQLLPVGERDLYLKAIAGWYSPKLVEFIKQLAAAFPDADAA